MIAGVISLFATVKFDDFSHSRAELYAGRMWASLKNAQETSSTTTNNPAMAGTPWPNLSSGISKCGMCFGASLGGGAARKRDAGMLSDYRR